MDDLSSERPSRQNEAARNAMPERSEGAAALFTSKPQERDELPINAWAIAGLVVLAIIAGLLLLGRHKPATSSTLVLPPDAYAANLPLTQFAMSESTSLSGGKSTFVDGHIRNIGARTVISVTAQVLFHKDEAMAPLIETVPLALIRTHEPYVDTQQVNTAPLKPGDEREFRLIFETLPTNWNGQMPEIRIIKVSTQ